MVQANCQSVRCSEFLKDLISFSLYKTCTVPVIMNTHQPVNAVTSINGIRVIAALWTTLGYSFVWEIQHSIIARNLRNSS